MLTERGGRIDLSSRQLVGQRRRRPSDQFDSGEQAAYRCQPSDAGLSLAAAADELIGKRAKA